MRGREPRPEAAWPPDLNNLPIELEDVDGGGTDAAVEFEEGLVVS